MEGEEKGKGREEEGGGGGTGRGEKIKGGERGGNRKGRW